MVAFKACTCLSEKEEGKRVCGKTVKLETMRKAMEIHSQAAKCGYDSDLFVATTMIDMYAKSGSLTDAEKVFQEMKNRDVVAWTTMVLAYAEQDASKHLALELLDRMQREGCAPISLTYVAALKACASLAMEEEGEKINGKVVKVLSLERGAAIHSKAEEQGFDLDLLVMNAAVDMYSKCGNMVDAGRTFDRMVLRTVTSWNTLMMGYVENGEASMALSLFSRMQREGPAPNPGTFVAALKASANLSALQSGRQVHIEICRYGHEFHEIVANSLVDAYGKCGSMTRAHQQVTAARGTPSSCSPSSTNWKTKAASNQTW
ncbi:pentatricopeptide repeat-containing protein At2g13600-like [Selaginella moellendorffii]|uniref:pentatricopeptide repeat-containing protein At2g13600-like n=1 Tax=Selaginella moellendorffii TaxID=88036 RepID=UPI000D1CE5AB|nr:pentatricopeptide repeat-containing protein At2g13600-like [Selaginella moellendorffii]XP_024540140.1 pentatricopeptide repeat-containing protein At2g13600-like [Selaginella moellendorffii]|eukprot:XP_024540139.1 pentatricopeptide repeat-containing protein At2g13600-like [Selaginella moellendorffii]